MAIAQSDALGALERAIIRRRSSFLPSKPLSLRDLFAKDRAVEVETVLCSPAAEPLSDGSRVSSNPFNRMVLDICYQQTVKIRTG